jgi:hypothetical protein
LIKNSFLRNLSVSAVSFPLDDTVRIRTGNFAPAAKKLNS